jgi:hypothetical protein
MSARPSAARDSRISEVSRRRFLQAAGATAGAGIFALGGSASPVWAVPIDAPAKPQPAESIVKLLYESLKEEQRKEVCFDWDYMDKRRGLLRTRLENNWKITRPDIKSEFFTADQQQMIRHIFEGITNPEWLPKWDEQLKGDVGGFGHRQSIAIFGTPGTGKFEFVLASRHMTLRCDGDSAEHVAFGGPILYAHEGEGLYEKPGHPSNVFWHQALAATELYSTLDGKQQKQALVATGMPSEELVGFRGPKGEFQGLPVSEMSKDQIDNLRGVLKLLLEPFRKADIDEATKCLTAQGGLEKCNLAFYKEGDLGNDSIWDNWRLEGPSFVWYFRGKPHVHVWVNIADDPSVALNTYQNSIL